MFWVITWSLMALLLFPAIVAFSKIPQENKNLWRAVVVALVFLAILPGVNLFVLFGIVVYIGVKLVNRNLDSQPNQGENHEIHE